jgi:hypothetical protein
VRHDEFDESWHLHCQFGGGDSNLPTQSLT